MLSNHFPPTTPAVGIEIVRHLSFLFFFGLLGFTPDHARATAIGFEGGVSYGRISSGSDSGSALGYGGGLTLELHIRRVGFETGGFLRKRAFGTSRRSYLTFETSETLRFWITRWIGIGVGGYFSQAFGKVTTVDTTTTFTAQGIRKIDYGIFPTLSFEARLKNRLHWAFDLRFHYGLRNISLNSVESRRFTEFLAMTGLRYFW